MSAATAINQQFADAPAKRTLYGDKKRKTESATHIIEFPGGAIELTRTEEGDYWAHIILNRGQALPIFGEGLGSARAEVVSSRIDWAERRLENIPHLPDEAHLTQIAVLIRPVREAR